MKTYRQDVNKFKHFIATLLQNQEMKKSKLARIDFVNLPHITTIFVPILGFTSSSSVIGTINHSVLKR